MHLLQSPSWGVFKSKFGWTPQMVSLPTKSLSVQILYRRLPFGFKIAYIPKGPTIDWQDVALMHEVLTHLKLVAAQAQTLFLKVEPDTVDSPAIVQQFLEAGFRPSRSIQPINTILVDLTDDEATILARMKSKTRYNIRLAKRKGITIRMGTAADLPIYHQLSQTTAKRDGFTDHPLAYYQACYHQFSDDQCVLLLAEFEGQPLAGVMIFAWDHCAYYLYGASNNQHRNKMPTYLLHWEAIQWAKVKGCHVYDLWGIPDASAKTLEAEFQTRSDGLWGVYRHKRGFGGQIIRSVGAFDYVHPAHYHKRLIYRAFSYLLKKRSQHAL